MVEIQDIANELEARGLSAHIYNASEISWVVWLFAADDPALGVFIGESGLLAEAFQNALSAWDNVSIQEVIPLLDSGSAENN